MCRGEIEESGLSLVKFLGAKVFIEHDAGAVDFLRDSAVLAGHVKDKC